VIGGYGYPVLRGNRITGNAEHGVKVEENGAGVVEDNDLTGNRQGAWHLDHKARRDVIQARNRE
jgi:parallel beta-helix repeat protein